MLMKFKVHTLVFSYNQELFLIEINTVCLLLIF